MSAAEQIERFCSVILGGPDGSGDDRLSGHMVYVWTLPDKRTRWYPADQPGAIASAVQEAVKNQRAGGEGVNAVYIGFGGVRAELARELGARHRPSADQVDCLPAFVADLDIAGFGHAGTNYPPDLDTALRILDEAGLPPTVIVHSGYGVQAWWMFSEPFVFSEEDDPAAARAEIATLSRDWLSTLRFRADNMGGWKLDSVFDLSRVMRAPGTWNMKNPDTPKPVRILKINAGAYYDPDDFRAHLIEQNLLDRYAARTSGKLGAQGLKELPGVDLGETWARVNSEFYRRLRHEPEWLSIVLDAEIGGDGLADTWHGRREDFAGDQSSYDAALIRILAAKGVSLEQQVEAVMCRRIRAGEKVDKIDPTRRTDYLLRTFGFVRAAMEEDRRKQGKTARMLASDAAVTVTSEVEPPPPPAPEPRPDVPGDGFAEYLEQELDAATGAADNVADFSAARERREEIPPPDEPPDGEEPPDEPPTGGGGDGPPEPPDEPPTGPPPAGGSDDEPDEPRPETPRPASPRALPVPARAEGDEGPDLWGTRNEATEERLGELSALLIPDEYRKRGVEVWRLEHRDYGENQKGRVVFKLPRDFGWPTGAEPKLFRRGKPLFSEWYKRDVFETPKGFRMALERDAMIPAQQVGNRKEDWQRIVSLLVSYWESDTSETDLHSSAREWLFDWLMTRTPTIEEHQALDNASPLLVRHNNWGADGPPVIYMPLKTWLAYVATMPGAPTGRKGKELLAYVRLVPRRPRLVGGDGLPRRVSWYEIAPEQFTAGEWADILGKVQEVIESNKQRLHVVHGGAS